jgi:hypothetical protein
MGVGGAETGAGLSLAERVKDGLVSRSVVEDPR